MPAISSTEGSRSSAARQLGRPVVRDPGDDDPAPRRPSLFLDLRFRVGLRRSSLKLCSRSETRRSIAASCSSSARTSSPLASRISWIASTTRVVTEAEASRASWPRRLTVSRASWPRLATSSSSSCARPRVSDAEPAVAASVRSTAARSASWRLRSPLGPLGFHGAECMPGGPILARCRPSSAPPRPWPRTRCCRAIPARALAARPGAARRAEDVQPRARALGLLGRDASRASRSRSSRPASALRAPRSCSATSPSSASGGPCASGPASR